MYGTCSSLSLPYSILSHTWNAQYCIINGVLCDSRIELGGVCAVGQPSEEVRSFVMPATKSRPVERLGRRRRVSVLFNVFSTVFLTI